MKQQIDIQGRKVGKDAPVFIIAEMSANHLMDYERAVEIIKQAAKAGADAIKLQTYTPDTITIDCDKEYFQIRQGTIWDGTTFYKLYKDAYTPWEWQPDLFRIAGENGLICFSSPFDNTAVDFMEKTGMPAYKIASFEINDTGLIRKAARTGKPVILSTGIALPEDIERALNICREEGNENVVLLKCTTTYPAPYEDINLRVIEDMSRKYNCITGISDHTMGMEVAVASVALGAKVIEKHFTLSRADGGPDAAFSMEPEEFRQLVQGVRNVEKALGKVTYELTEKQKNSRKHSRSLFVVNDMKAGDEFTEENVKSIRPGYGLHTMYYADILGKHAAVDIERGTPMAWELMEEGRK